ncbi:MAG: hypothetical protein V4601_10595 [Pseudomonadota bacterium]
MKRLICATLALSLLGATAASAQPYRGGGHHRSHNGGNGAALVGLGLGLFALGAIAASSQRDRYSDRYYDSYDYGPPPPPRYRSRYGYERYGYRY